MIPRSDIEAININEPWSEMVKFIKETKYSQVVFHDENIDNIIGYSMKTALLNTKKKDIRNKLREPIFVPESKTILSLLGDMKLKKNHIAVILDEYGGTSGLITMKDIIDSIFIKDIIMKTYIQKKSENMWLVDGETKIVDINNAFDLFLPVESQTISGYVINMIGSIPEKGTTVRISENLMVVILESDSRQIELMELRKIDH
jgi:CBS domain containing-hemolysin-like protein